MTEGREGKEKEEDGFFERNDNKIFIFMFFLFMVAAIGSPLHGLITETALKEKAEKLHMITAKTMIESIEDNEYQDFYKDRAKRFCIESGYKKRDKLRKEEVREAAESAWSFCRNELIEQADSIEEQNRREELFSSPTEQQIDLVLERMSEKD